MSARRRPRRNRGVVAGSRCTPRWPLRCRTTAGAAEDRRARIDVVRLEGTDHGTSVAEPAAAVRFCACGMPSSHFPTAAFCRMRTSGRRPVCRSSTSTVGRRAGSTWLRPTTSSRNSACACSAVDRPGYGGSTPNPGRLRADWTADALQFIDGMGIERCAVVGYSAGGPYALELAATHPDRVTGVGVLAGSTDMGWPGAWEQLPERARDRPAAPRRSRSGAGAVRRDLPRRWIRVHGTPAGARAR